MKRTIIWRTAIAEGEGGQDPDQGTWSPCESLSEQKLPCLQSYRGGMVRFQSIL